MILLKANIFLDETSRARIRFVCIIINDIIIAYLLDNLKIISIVHFSLYEFDNGLFPLYSVTLTFIADQRLLWSLTFNTGKTEISSMAYL